MKPLQFSATGASAGFAPRTRTMISGTRVTWSPARKAAKADRWRYNGAEASSVR